LLQEQRSGDAPAISNSSRCNDRQFDGIDDRGKKAEQADHSGFGLSASNAPRSCSICRERNGQCWEFTQRPTYLAAADVLVEIGKQGGVRVHRPAVLRACLRALQLCGAAEGLSLHDAAIRLREQNRLIGRPLPRRAVGSTLLLKGLEGDVAVVLNAAALDSRNLYVAMTRGSKGLIVCSSTPVLNPD
jgi:hypothetical protein